MPPAPGLTGNALRQVVYVSIGGEQLRLRLSNELGDGPVTMRSVHVAPSTGAAGIDAARDTSLTFAGAASVTIPAGQAVASDPFTFALRPLAKVAITIHFGEVPAGVTGHPGSRTTSFLGAGNTPVEHWYYITGLDVAAGPNAGAVVALGDSITGGRGSTTDGNDRWTDVLSRRLRANPATTHVAVLNQGIGGNAVLRGGLGPTALERFQRDVLDQRGARWLIVFEGVNDIGIGDSATVARDLVTAYEALIGRARGHGIRAYGATITPFAGSQYDTADREAARRAVNDWIRGGGRFDAVLDFDAAVRDPDHPPRLLSVHDSGDHLHLSPTGYRKLADAVDLELFG
jgi:lysophospholipase L1-like esterase